MKTAIIFLSGAGLGALVCGGLLYFLWLVPLQEERDRLRSEHKLMLKFMDLYGQSQYGQEWRER